MLHGHSKIGIQVIWTVRKRRRGHGIGARPTKRQLVDGIKCYPWSAAQWRLSVVTNISARPNCNTLWTNVRRGSLSCSTCYLPMPGGDLAGSLCVDMGARGDCLRIGLVPDTHGKSSMNKLGGCRCQSAKQILWRVGATTKHGWKKRLFQQILLHVCKQTRKLHS